MRALVKDEQVVVIPDGESEREAVEARLAGWDGHAFNGRRSGGALVLTHLGPFDDVFRTPLNVTSFHQDPAVRLISNFAPTAFELDGEAYASVEGFWQSLKATHRDDRVRIAGLSGGEARAAGQALDPPACVSFRGQYLRWGRPEHWDLMRLACRAKFTQVADARAALLATGQRPLTHRMRRDSRSIPGVIMAGIWRQLRDELAIEEAR
jgi:predicted NAD-dependent protein-ADP-ribosyltransferase YbiA (DUF1768 family)